MINKRADELKVGCEYGVFKKLSSLLQKYGCLIVDIEYYDGVTVTFAVDEKDSEILQAEIVDLTQGKATISVDNNGYYQFEI